MPDLAFVMSRFNNKLKKFVLWTRDHQAFLVNALVTSLQLFSLSIVQDNEGHFGDSEHICLTRKNIVCRYLISPGRWPVGSLRLARFAVAVFDLPCFKFCLWPGWLLMPKSRGLGLFLTIIPILCLFHLNQDINVSSWSRLSEVYSLIFTASFPVSGQIHQPISLWYWGQSSSLSSSTR